MLLPKPQDAPVTLPDVVPAAAEATERSCNAPSHRHSCNVPTAAAAAANPLPHATVTIEEYLQGDKPQRVYLHGILWTKLINHRGTGPQPDHGT